MTAVSAAGQRITNEIDGWGRSLLIRAPGVTVRERSYALHPQLGYVIRETRGNQRRVIYHDGWLRPVRVVETSRDGRKQSRSMRYTHHERVDRTVLRSRRSSESRPLQFGRVDDDTGTTIVDEEQTWNGQPTAVGIDDGDGPALEIVFSPSGMTIELAPQTWSIPNDLGTAPIHLDAKDPLACSSSERDPLQYLHDTLSDAFPQFADPQRANDGCNDFIAIGLDDELALAQQTADYNDFLARRSEYLSDRVARRRARSARDRARLMRGPDHARAPFVVVGSAGGRALIKPEPHWSVRRFFFEGGGDNAYTTFHLKNRATDEERVAELPGYWFEAHDTDDGSLIYQEGMPRWEAELITTTFVSATELIALLRFPTCTGGRPMRWKATRTRLRTRIKPESEVLNLGSGDNPMEGAVNVDVRPSQRVDVVASAENLPFQSGSFSEAHAVNPYNYQPVSAETARVMKPDSLLRVTGNKSNKWAKPLSAKDALKAGFEIVETTPAIERHKFGTPKRTDGTKIMGELITTTYRRLP